MQHAAAHAASSSLLPTPPMGWMAWQVFRCEVDCQTNPDHCINSKLFRAQTDALVEGGYLAVGYDTVHVDDCWMASSRDPGDGTLRANGTRFPEDGGGMAGLGRYVHSKGAKLGLYTAESATTCAGYPASAGHEALDAAMFASWEVDYVKVDGCGDPKYYAGGYGAMGDALRSAGRDIVYSCSWPAYLGASEKEKEWVYGTMISMGCNLWRNYNDVQCSWESLSDIIEHWGLYGETLDKYAGPGHYNDPDMLLVGNDCITDDEAKTQMAIWCIVAAPLIMGNDLRSVSDVQRSILLNEEAIAVDQDRLVRQGGRIISGNAANDGGQVWARTLHDGSCAVALYNPTDRPLNVSFAFGDVCRLPGTTVAVRDIWARRHVGRFSDGLSRIVRPHGTDFLKLLPDPRQPIIAQKRWQEDG